MVEQLLFIGQEIRAEFTGVPPWVYGQLAQTSPVANDLISSWTEAKSITVVLSILTIILFYVSWYLLRLYIRKTEEVQQTVMTIQSSHDSEQRELQVALRTQLKEVTQAITELTILIRERLVKE